MKVNQELQAEFLEGKKKEVMEGRTEPGCLRSDFLKGTDKRRPNSFLSYECFTDDKAAEEHMATHAFQAATCFKNKGGIEFDAPIKASAMGVWGGRGFQG